VRAEGVLADVERYYTGRLREHGPTPAGVDWNGEASQVLRFRQLLRAIDPIPDSFSLLDYGCGYGALLALLESLGRSPTYYGFDISQEMVEEARRNHPGFGFTTDLATVPQTDYVVASGIFNVRLEASDEAWERHVRETLRVFAGRSSRGWAANFLTVYSDADRMRPYLYYADPGRLMDFVKRDLGASVAIFHDYGLYEFTLSSRKAPWGAT
jgi:SAM-dependent methyltransferase